DLLQRGAFGLILNLPGCDTSKDPAPIVRAHAQWVAHVKDAKPYKGFVSPVVVKLQEHEISTALQQPIIGKIEPIEFIARRPFLDSEIAISVSISGTLLTIPGIFAFIIERQRRRDELAEREEKKRKEEEEKQKEQEHRLQAAREKEEREKEKKRKQDQE